MHLTAGESSKIGKHTIKKKVRLAHSTVNFSCAHSQFSLSILGISVTYSREKAEH